MAQFAYVARTEAGELRTGTVMADTLDNAGLRLSNDRLFVVKLSPFGQSDASPGRTTGFGPTMPRKEVIAFTTQLAVMLGAGIPLSEVLTCMASQARNPVSREILEHIATQVIEGRPLSDALALHPRSFPPVMTALVQASELSGTMSVMLPRAGEYLTKEQTTRSKIRGAILYPGFMFVMCLGVTIFVLTVIMPKFTVLFASRGAALPAPTRMLIFLSGILVDYWAVWTAGAIAAIVGGVFWYRSTTGRRQVDWLKLHLPIFRPIFHNYYLALAFRTLQTLVDTGVPIMDAVAILKNVTRNSYFQDLWDQVLAAARDGEQISVPMLRSPLVPEQIGRMVAAGDRSGRMGMVCRGIADYVESEFDNAVKVATQFIEPVLIVFMGSMIGFVAISLLLPIFSAGRVLAGK